MKLTSVLMFQNNWTRRTENFISITLKCRKLQQLWFVFYNHCLQSGEHTSFPAYQTQSAFYSSIFTKDRF